jgi:hypothetical protein
MFDVYNIVFLMNRTAKRSCFVVVQLALHKKGIHFDLMRTAQMSTAMHAT